MAPGPEGEDKGEIGLEEELRQVQAVHEHWDFWIEDRRREYERKEIDKMELVRAEKMYAQGIAKVEEIRKNIQRKTN